MSNRLQIDNKVKEKAIDFYYSATDMYGVDLFSDDFENQNYLIKCSEEQHSADLTASLFGADKKETVTYAFCEQMFLTKQYERKYKSPSDDLGIYLYIICGILAGVISLIGCMVITEIVKRKNKNGNNNKR